MTKQQAIQIAHIEAQHEAERFTADQAAREQPELDELSVRIAVQVHINAGRMDEARAMWRAYRDSQKGQ